MEITKELLSKMYFAENKGLNKIADELGVGIRTIRTKFEKFGIEMRPFHMKGRQNRLGAILSDETKKKISDAHMGKKLSPEHRAKVIKTLLYGLKGSENPSWKGGITEHDGYILIKLPNHPHAYKNGYVKRAVLVAEQKLGRLLLPNEVTHHINGDKQDDSPENIEILTASQHNSVTMRERWLKGSMSTVILRKNQGGLKWQQLHQIHIILRMQGQRFFISVHLPQRLMTVILGHLVLMALLDIGLMEL